MKTIKELQKRCEEEPEFNDLVEDMKKLISRHVFQAKDYRSSIRLIENEVRLKFARKVFDAYGKKMAK